jgi:hypothetical protein
MGSAGAAGYARLILLQSRKRLEPLGDFTRGPTEGPVGTKPRTQRHDNRAALGTGALGRSDAMRVTGTPGA